MIDVQRLLVLREVAHAGSFAGAAIELRRTPSAVSQQITALERGAGVPLVERSTRGVVLTDAGRILLAAADAVHAELQTAARQLNDLQANGPQTLTIATFASAGEPLLAPALTELTTAAGNTIDVTVIEAEPDDALASLRSGGADLALVYHFETRQPPGHWPGAAGPGAYIPLVDDHIRLLAAPAARAPTPPTPCGTHEQAPHGRRRFGKWSSSPGRSLSHEAVTGRARTAVGQRMSDWHSRDAETERCRGATAERSWRYTIGVSFAGHP